MHGIGAHRDRIPAVLCGLRTSRFLDHATVPDGDPAVSTHLVPGDASTDSARLDRRLRQLDLTGCEEVFGGSVAKLARAWRKLDADRKQQVAELVGAAATSLIAALVASRGADAPAKRRKSARKGKKTLQKVAKTVKKKLKTKK